MRILLIQKRALQFALLAAALVAVFFHGVPRSRFLYLHDEFLSLSGYEIANQYSVRSLLDFGTSETIQTIVTLFDRIYYALAFLAGLDVWATQVLLYGLKLFVLLLLPYFGFRRLVQTLAVDVREEIVLASSLWYSFNTYTVIYWHGNAFSLTLLVCYALAPLALCWWEKAILSEGPSSIGERLSDVLILAQLLFLMSFALYMFAPFVLLLAAYTALRLAFGRAKLLRVVGRLSWLALACAPLFIVQLMIGYEMFFLSVNTGFASGGETYGNMQGGLLYMSLMWFAWTIYTYWSPRNIWTFASYYHTAAAMAAPFVLYGVIAWGALRQRKDIRIVAFTLLFLAFLLLAKGPQLPLGDIYLFMIERIPGFRVFRSPDSKFGFPIVLSVSVLLVLAGRAIRVRTFMLLVGAAAVIQSWPLLTGLAIRGENTADSHDRIIFIPPEYRQLAEYLNAPDRAFGYIMPLPPTAFGAYQFGENEEHAGQDLLPKLINLPFVYRAESSGMPIPTYEKLNDLIQTGHYRDLRQFSIRYYVVRSDLKSQENSRSALVASLSKNHRLVFENNIFSVYEDVGALPLVEGGDVSFDVKSPVRIDIKLPSHRMPRNLVMHQSYHPSWRLYADDLNPAPANGRGVLIALYSEWLETISFLWRTPIAEDSHSIAYGYANSWDIPLRAVISPTPPNLILFYFPQAVFCLLASVSALFAGGYFLAAAALIIRQNLTAQ